MRQFFLDRVRQDPLLDGQNYIYMHYADMIANGYHRAGAVPVPDAGHHAEPDGGLFFCENSEVIGNVADGRSGSDLLPRGRAGSTATRSATRSARPA